MKLTLAEIAKRTGAVLEGDPSYVVEGAAGLAEAGPLDLSFLENPKYAPQVAASRAGAILVPPQARGISGGPAHRLYAENPKGAYALVLAEIERERRPPETPGVHARAEIEPGAELGRDVHVGAGAVVRAGARVGDGAVIGALCYIGRGARVGARCVLHPHVVVEDGCELGERVIAHSGVVIGSDGYGFWTDPKTGRHHKVPQVGRVVVEDDVELGANVSIDRATTGETRVGAGTKIDNLVQIGHNVQTGPDCLIVAQVGLAGSTRVGRGVVLGGQVGVAGHLAIGDGAMIAAQSGIMGDVAPKSVLFGTPARPHREAMKLQVLLGRLPELFDAVKELKSRLLSGGKETAS